MNKFFEVVGEVDSLVANVPDEMRVKRFCELVDTSPVVKEYAFRTLARADWIAPLKRREQFSYAELSGCDAGAGLKCQRMWPQAHYLKRMAKTDDRGVQEQVLTIMLAATCANNYFIHSDFTEAALTMPGDLAARWAGHETQWLHEGNRMEGCLEENLGKLITKLAKEGEPGVALGLATELLAVLPDPEAEMKRNPKNEAERITFSSLHPAIRCDRYIYEQVLKNNIPDVAEAIPLDTLELLCSLLEQAVLLSHHQEQWKKPHDATYIWRPAIEDHEQNHDDTVDCLLIVAVRDTAEGICRRTPDETGAVVQRVEDHGWDVFRRLALHLLRVATNAPPTLVREHLVNEDLFNHAGVQHEYFHLSKARFGELSAEDQQTILNWIANATEVRTFLAEQDKKFTEEQKANQIKHWQFRRLNAIQEYLTGEWKDRFDAWNQDPKQSELPPDFHSYTSSGSFDGPKSPKKPDELALMSVTELISFLKDWQPSGEWLAPTPDGLGAALGGLVTLNPDRYGADVERFMDAGMDPTYIRHVLSGFCRALEGGKSLPYQSVFKICKWVEDRQSGIPGRSVPEGLRDGLEVDRTWRNAKAEIARLVDKSLEEKTRLPSEYRKQIWDLIQPLTEDPEPDLEYEKKYGGDNMDPLTLSLNTIRGKALHAVMAYAMWVGRTIKESAGPGEGRRPALGDMPEVVAVLDRHLDPQVDCSRTSRAVYGQWLPQLVYLGPDWVAQNLPRIFPPAPDLKPLRDAVWQTYLLYGGNIYRSVTKAVMSVYREEVLALKGKQFGEKISQSPESRLAEHVLVMYLWQEYGLEEGSLIDLFFRTAPTKLTACAMDFIGRDTANEKTPDPAITARMKTLWDWRLVQTGGLNNMPPEELASFGWWFAGAQFDAAWSLAKLEEALTRTGLGHCSVKVWERLSTLFATHPHECLRCLRLFIDRNTDPWFFRRAGKDQGVWTLLEQAMASADAGIRDPAEEIIHLLGSKGYLEYRQLLKKQRPEAQ